jgi:hypothetical protein
MAGITGKRTECWGFDTQLINVKLIIFPNYSPRDTWQWCHPRCSGFIHFSVPLLSSSSFLQSSARQRRVPGLEASSTGTRASSGGSQANKQGQGGPAGAAAREGRGGCGWCGGSQARRRWLAGEAAVETRGGCGGENQEGRAEVR